MLSNKRFKFIDKGILEKGLRLLIKELGYSGFLRFIRHSEGLGEENYLKLGDEIFRDMSLDGIFYDTDKHCRNKD